MNSEFFKALEELEAKQGVPADVMLKKTEEALIKACEKEFAGKNCAGLESKPVIEVVSDREKCDIKAYLVKTVVAEIDDPVTQILLADAREHYNKRITVGKQIRIEIKTKNLHRISAKAAKDVIIQGIREAEKENARREFENKQEEIVTATVVRIDRATKTAELNVDAGILELPAAEQIPGEILEEGSRVKVYVRRISRKDGREDTRVSRIDPGFVKCLFRLQVPEIDAGIVQIRNIAREPGSRTKISVWSSDETVEAVGACVGPKGMRISAILDELGGEKVDIVTYSESPEEYVKAALAPASVTSVEMTDERSAHVVVAPDQLSLAIGKEGQNARLAAKLTSCKIDIKTE